MSELLSLEAASFRYRGAAIAAGPFDLRVGAGDTCLITGSSGCGKSTLARMCAGAIPHLYRGTLAGGVRLRGRPTRSEPLWRIVEEVGLVGQNPAAQLVGSTVHDEVAFGLASLRLSRREVSERIEAALAWAELEDRANSDPRRLSGGEQQRLVIASCAARRPRVLVFDEPLSMLDGEATARVARMLVDLPREGTAAVVLEHRWEELGATGGVRRLDLGGGARFAREPALPEPLPQHAPFRIVARSLRTVGKRVLSGVDLELAGGSVVAVTGPNGSGKTTLLRALLGLEEVRGAVRIEARSGPAPRLGMAFQNPDRQIFNGSVRDEILFGVTRPDAARYRSVVEALGLSGVEAMPPLLLSEGEKKRLGLATLLVRTDVGGFLLDEPTLGQDPAHRLLLGRLVRRLADAGALVVAATHDLSWARRFADRVVGLRDGRVVEDRVVSSADAPDVDAPAEVA